MTSPRRSIRPPRRERILLAVTIVAAVTLCIVLGLWQWHRFEARSAEADTVATHYDADPVALDDVLSDPEDPLPESQDWTPVELRGQYCTEPGCVLYVRNRPLDGSVGFWQLVPFETDQGTVLIVRGWVEGDEVSSVPAEEPEIPAGPLTVTAHLRPVEPVLEDRSNPSGQVQSVAPQQFAEDLPVDGPVYGGTYGNLIAESPTSITRPTPLEAPSTSLGPHLSYAFQWWVFALLIPIGLLVRSRRAAAEERALTTDGAENDEPATEDGSPGSVPSEADRAPTRQGRSPESHRRRRARSRDEEEEDALVDDFRP